MVETIHCDGLRMKSCQRPLEVKQFVLLFKYGKTVDSKLRTNTIHNYCWELNINAKSG